MASLEPITMNVELNVNVKPRPGTWCRAMKKLGLDEKWYVAINLHGQRESMLGLLDEVEWRPVPRDDENAIEVRVDRVKRMEPPVVPVFIAGMVVMVSGDLLREGV
jgi:hypothetical protein